MDKVELYLSKKTKWKEELELLRNLLLQSELNEDFKWSLPTYTLNGRNVIGMASFKQYVGLWFFNGVFLSDKHQLLINAQENKTRGLRQLRFNSIDEMDKNIIREYIEEAIQNQKEGKEIKIERSKKLIIPSLFQVQLNKSEALTKAFKRLTKGKQNEYAEYISAAKQEKTKLSRIKKIIPMILEGKGLHDQYKKS